MNTPQEEGAPPFVPPQALTPADQRLDDLFDRLEAQSITTIEGHARHLVTLSTTLLAAFFGLLSLNERPAFLNQTLVQILAGLAAVAFFAALLFALDALRPQRYAAPRADLTAKRQILENLLRRKTAALALATMAFGLAVALMLLIVLITLFVA